MNPTSDLKGTSFYQICNSSVSFNFSHRSYLFWLTRNSFIEIILERKVSSFTYIDKRVVVSIFCIFIDFIDLNFE
ncbi:unnamed protein product [Phytomonas sp. EM1]|nr:unnamed protein product [Phytomonas sp. EM1]|eukprot:CCW62891.1 unnamed protein product [Phytomonas sp. isolate EM1]